MNGPKIDGLICRRPALRSKKHVKYTKGCPNALKYSKYLDCVAKCSENPNKKKRIIKMDLRCCEQKQKATQIYARY